MGIEDLSSLSADEIATAQAEAAKLHNMTPAEYRAAIASGKIKEGFKDCARGKSRHKVPYQVPDD